MAQRDQPQKSSLWGNLAFFAFIIGVIVFFTLTLMGPSDDEVRSQQLDPEGAIEAYLFHADGFKNYPRSNFADVEKTVAKADWEWFYDNYQNIFSDWDVADIQGAIDPTQGEAMARVVVLQALQAAGPIRKDSIIREVTVNGNSATALVAERDYYTDGTYDYTQHKVPLVKEGKYWKVKDFGGGRAEFENRRQPGDLVSFSREEIEGGGAGGPAGMAVAEGGGGQPEGGAPAGGAPAGQPTQGGTGSGNLVIPQNEITATARVNQARDAWAAGDAMRAYQHALLAYTFYSQNFGPQDPRTQQTMSMGTQARGVLVQQGQTPPTLEQILAGNGNGAGGNAAAAPGAPQPRK